MWVVAEQVLCPQFLQNVNEGLIQAVEPFRVKDAATGRGSQRGESVFASDIPSRLIGNWNDHNWIDDGIGPLGGCERILVALIAGGISAVGDNHQNMPPISA